MKTLIASVVVLASTAVTAQGRKPDHYLDVAGQTRSEIPPGTFFPGRNSIGASAHRMAPSTLKLTLVSIERAAFVYGEHFTYEVLIENAGNVPITLPWSPNEGAFAQPFPRTPAGFLGGSIYLQVESESGGTLGLLNSQAMYGSQETPGSLLVLGPGRTALLRMPTQWSATMDGGRAKILQQPEGAVRLRAVLGLYLDDFPLTRSTNTLPVRITPRQLP